MSKLTRSELARVFGVTEEQAVSAQDVVRCAKDFREAQEQFINACISQGSIFETAQANERTAQWAAV